MIKFKKLLNKKFQLLFIFIFLIVPFISIQTSAETITKTVSCGTGINNGGRAAIINCYAGGGAWNIYDCVRTPAPKCARYVQYPVYPNCKVNRATLSWNGVYGEAKIYMTSNVVNEVKRTYSSFGPFYCYPSQGGWCGAVIYGSQGHGNPVSGSKDVTNLVKSGFYNRLYLYLYERNHGSGSFGGTGGTATINIDVNCCSSNQGQSCSAGIGECRRTGIYQCNGQCSASPGSPSTEICDNKDNDCNNVVDNTCDDDNDNYCDSSITIIGTPSTCTAGGNDQNDNDLYINPGFPEICDNKDNDQDSLTDEGCDSDKDSYSEKPATCLGNFKDGNNIVRSCSQFGPPNNGDCNDANANINPAISEICNNIDDDCDETIDEGCDDDKDGFVDPIMTCVANFLDGNGVVRPCP
jgi:hypothetical protein|tara:strand:+ start:2165 stop:3391 length:1227 start_codon:yes stop_codon:yes gene_type:complete